MLSVQARPRCLPRTMTARFHGSRQALLDAMPKRQSAGSPLLNRRLPTALFFPGHGVQRVGMANPWIESFPNFARRFLDEMDSTLGFHLSRTLTHGPSSSLNKTENAQPAIMATSIMILRILETEFGFDTKSHVDVTLGHSLGEFAALVAGGYLELSDALKLVRRRGEIMAECTRRASEQFGETYGMVALICEPDHLDSLLRTIHEFLGLESPGFKDDSNSEMPSIQQVMVAHINSKNQLVLSGSIERIRSLLTQLRQFGGHDPRAVRLKCDSPFHSPIMAPAAAYMKDALEEVPVSFPGSIPCISNVTGLPFHSKENVKTLLSRQCVDTVRWWDSVRYLDQERDVKRWIGIGPGKVSRNLIGKEVGKGRAQGGGVLAVCHPRELEDFMRMLDQPVPEDPCH